jgi:hypothetical protein
MFINDYICCWMFMVLCRIKLDEFWVKIANFAPQTRRNSLLAKYFNVFISTFYNFITPKQHLGNVHNIK